MLFALALLALSASAQEAMNRGLVAVLNEEGKPYLGWRLLKSDPPQVAFNVYRRSAGGRAIKVNSQPITTSTNLVDSAAPKDQPNSWFVRAVINKREAAPSESVQLDTMLNFKLQGNYLFNRVGIADLDG